MLGVYQRLIFQNFDLQIVITDHTIQKVPCSDYEKLLITNLWNESSPFLNDGVKPCQNKSSVAFDDGSHV